MYIIAIAWMYVTILMAATEKTWVAGILTFTFYGLIPCAILLWILGAKHRRFQSHNKASLQQEVREADRRNTEGD